MKAIFQMAPVYFRKSIPALSKKGTRTLVFFFVCALVDSKKRAVFFCLLRFGLAQAVRTCALIPGNHCRLKNEFAFGPAKDGKCCLERGVALRRHSRTICRPLSEMIVSLAAKLRTYRFKFFFRRVQTQVLC